MDAHRLLQDFANPESNEPLRRFSEGSLLEIWRLYFLEMQDATEQLVLVEVTTEQVDSAKVALLAGGTLPLSLLFENFLNL